METKNGTNYRQPIIDLLSLSKLPVDDLPQTLDHFIVAINDDKVVGVAGIEHYNEFGLLRSVAVNPSCRNKGMAGALVQHIERLAAGKGIQALYLFTETASDFFHHKGYERVDRAEVPEAVQRSSEFSHVCPQSALVMRKKL